MHFTIVNAEIDNIGNGNKSKEMADFKAVFNKFTKIHNSGYHMVFETFKQIVLNQSHP